MHGIPCHKRYAATVFNVASPGPDYTLRWPAAIFASEARVLLGETDRSDWADRVEWLLTEAFVSDTPLDDFLSATKLSVGFDPSASSLDRLATVNDPPQRALVKHLHGAAPRLPQQGAPRPYYADRNGGTIRPGDEAPDRVARLKQDWLAAVRTLIDNGYLEKIAPRPCVANDSPPEGPAVALDSAFADRLGTRGLWFSDDPWDQDTFYSMIEVVHDLVARPRRRRYHTYNQCGWHYSGFAIVPAQMLYRWTVNQLLDRNGVPLHLAKSGQDTGRLVHAAGDDRDQLVQRTLSTPGTTDRDAVSHAVALFRSRTSTRENKRSAVVALARVLEDRRTLLKAELLSGDEQALFHIANKFDLRHRDGKQKDNYRDEFLDWIFWWYLATLELTDRFLARPADLR